ncbi:MAG: sulfite exporter TauE/SafE family protein, partial [Gemmatimonadetes bacterium]|nr:sulfite exporter TauE/SafE family protein [Gemmatimonadota bacterium]
MCGAFACFYATGPQGSDAAEWTAHAAYNAGRLVGYVSLGVLGGALGLGVDAAGAAAGVQQGAAIVAGLL